MQSLREKWSDRLTGNDILDKTDTDYQNIMEKIDEKALLYFDSFILATEGKDTRTTLWNDLNLTVSYIVSNDASYTVDFNKAFERIYSLTLAYSSKGSRFYKRQDFKDVIMSALEWMYQNVYNENYDVEKRLYGNWWHWEIGMPQYLADIIILLYDELDVDFINKEYKTLVRFCENPAYVYKVNGLGKSYMTSGNLMDTALISVLKSIIGNDSKGMNQAKEAVSTVLPYVRSGDGFYEDGSCIQHKNLAYTGGYGLTLIKGIEKVLFLIDDTPWKVTDENINIMYQWIWEGYRPLFVDGIIMDMVSGRSIARPHRTDMTTARGILEATLLLSIAAPALVKSDIQSFVKKHMQSAMEYDSKYLSAMPVREMIETKKLLNDDSIIAEAKVPYFKLFAAMDKAVHHTEKFSLGISMYSNRTGSFEYGNEENAKGYHTSDGALYLYNGDQAQFADNYWPTVDHMRLPGITTDHTVGTLDPAWNGYTSSKSWVGGSSLLNLYGSVGMEFEIENSTLTGKKSWFLFDNEVVVLGAGITSTENKNTETIVENRKIDRNNEFLINGLPISETKGETITTSNVTHAWLSGNLVDNSDSIGYYFPEETDLDIVREARTASWRDINTSISPSSEAANPVTREYVSFAIKHGINPINASYSYVLLPGMTPNEVNSYQSSPEIKIISNNELVQAVKETNLNVSGYNFWSAGSVDGVNVQSATSLTIKETDIGLSLGVSDPTQEQDSIKVILDKVYNVIRLDTNVTVSIINGQTEIIINTEGAQGKTYYLELCSKMQNKD